MESAAEGRDGLARLLLFLPAPSEQEIALLTRLEDFDGTPLTALLREVGLSPAHLAKRVADAKMELEREVARGLAVDAAPAIIEDLLGHALDRMRRCPRLCVQEPGMGPKTMVRLGTDVQVCPVCLGNGETVQSSPHKTWAADRALKIAALPEEAKGPLVAIQNNVSTGKGASLLPDLMERIAKAAHAVVGRTEIVEAEIVAPVPQEPSLSTPPES